MANIKKYSTGEIGNSYPTRDTSDNPNTKGLTTDERPGIEAYIQEDPVDAATDNRPLKNLVSNDILLDKNSSDVASEVDSGIFKDRYNEFDVEVQSQDNYTDPENSTSKIYVTPIRVKSGSSIINGSVTRVGSQKIIYFIKAKNNQIIFPEYGTTIEQSITINDPNYDGNYEPVYDSVASDFPDDYSDYEIQIINTYTDGTEERVQYFKTFRDYEDIVPYKPHEGITKNEIVDFSTDINYGQSSEGYWLRSGGSKNTLAKYTDLPAISTNPTDGDIYYVLETQKYYKFNGTSLAWVETTDSDDINGVKGTVVSSVKLQKNISVKDKILKAKDFISDNGNYSHNIVTDGIFFEDITWTETIKIDPSADILDMYVNEDDDIYFITKGLCKVLNTTTNQYETRKYLFRLTNGAIEIENKSTGADVSDNITYTRMRKIGNYLFLMGTSGFITTWNLTQNFNSDVVNTIEYFKNNSTTESFKDAFLWEDNLFIATDTKLFYTNFDKFDPLSSTFTEINVQLEVVSKKEEWKGNVATFSSLPTIKSKNDIYFVTDEKKCYQYDGTNWNVYTYENIVKSINKLDQVKGNTIVTSSIDTNIENLLQNPSFEEGISNAVPNCWKLESASGLSTSKVISKTSSDALSGNFKIFLTKNNLDVTTSIYQDVELSTVDTDYTFSVYLAPTDTNTITGLIKIEEYSSSNVLLGSSSQNFSVNGSISDWKRVSTSHKIVGSASYLRVSITSEIDGVALQVDNAQLEVGTVVNQYVENFDYLFIGFEKVSNNEVDSPFALIDKKEKYVVQYTPSIYGDISTINDTKFIKNNLMYAVSNEKIYSINFLNNESEYNRISICEMNNSDDEFNFHNRISKFETIDVFNNRVFVGGTVSNKVIRFRSNDYDSHTITLSSTTSSTKESLVKLLGSTTENVNTTTSNYSIEFDRTKYLMESTDNTTSEGKYIPGATYTLTISIDDNINENAITIDVTMPDKYSEPYSIELLAAKIKTAFESAIAIKPDITIETSSSSTIVDGFISFGKLDVVRHIRGDIHKIFLKDGETDYFYLARNKQIFKTKNDPNVLKNDNDEYVSTNWDLINSGYSVKEYKNVLNKEITVSDNAYNTSYIDLGVTNGYNLLRGSLKIKTNDITQTGYTEDIDYEVDYDNYRIIRKFTDNFAVNNQFLYGSLGSTPNNWKKWGNKTGGIGTEGVKFNKIVDKTEFVDYSVQMYILPATDSTHPRYDSSKVDNTTYVTSNTDSLMSAYQIYIPSNMNIGDTYTFSVYLNSYKSVTSYLSLVESQSYSTAGHQTWMFDSAKTLSSSSGLANNNTIYGCTVTVDGSAYTVSFQGNVAQTIQQVINLMNTQLGTKGAYVEWVSTGNGGLKISSVTKGSSSSIAITNLVVNGVATPYLFNPSEGLSNISDKATETVNGNVPKVERDNLQLITGEYTNATYTIDSANVGKWTRFSVTHTVTSDDSDCLRFEIRSPSQNPIYVAKPQLERNTRATPYVISNSRSRIDPDSKVFVDYIEYKELISGTTFADGSVDYIFDTTNRKIILRNVDLLSDYYMNYKYDRIFNGHVYGDRLPIYRVIYDSRDDFFLYEFEGRIWAINQMLSMLSFDTEDPMYISYSYHFPRVDIVKIRNEPDKYGNYCYIVKGKEEKTNAYRPFDRGTYTSKYVTYADAKDVEDTIDNEILYEINVTNLDYSKNDIYDRRIYITAKDHSMFNISLTPETVAYFPYTQDFNATNGMMPLYTPTKSKIVSIIKNYTITQKEEIGAWHDGYDSTLRKIISFPGASFCIFVSLDSGDDSNNGLSEATAVRTITKALSLTYYNNINSRRNNIVITTSNGVINEDVLVKTSGYDVYLLAKTYSTWRGALQNETPLYVQGVYFENSSLYPYDSLNLYYCTLEDTNINCSSPETVGIYNTEIKNNHDSVIRVSDVLFPSPFVHPYQRNPMRDDGVSGSGDIATSDNESIAPGDSWYNSKLATQPTGAYTFSRCLIYGSTDHVVQYDPDDDINNWISTFKFDQCTITRNYGLFSTNKYNLSITYSESIIVKNGEDRNTDTKQFDSNSNISIENCFIDFEKEGESTYINYGEGVVSNRTTCSGGVGSDPLFLTITDTTLDFHLRSIARGSTLDSPCLDASSQSHDLGCYDEIRTRTEVDIPKKLRSKVAHLKEGIKYPVVLNSEKITFSMLFKPIGTATDNFVLLDTRTSANDEDYLVVCYNNNAYDDEQYIIEPNPKNTLDMPNTFKVVVANKEKIYSVVSPVEIYSDEDFQQWHRLTFSINYELVYKTKTNFTDEDRQQNIITFYHNDQLAVESYIKYDLQRGTDGELISGNFDGYNAWNYNDISSVVTLGSDYKEEKVLECYCSEIRIDNRFIDRKELDLWRVKDLPFNDPFTRVNEATLAKTIEPSTLNEYWSLKTKFDRGAKWNKFTDESSNRTTYLDKQLTWVLTRPTNNLFIQSGCEGMKNAEVVSTSAIEWSKLSDPIEVDSDWIISSIGSRTAIDTEIVLATSGNKLYSKSDLNTMLSKAFASHSNSNVGYNITSDGRIRFYTKDYGVTSLTLNLGQDYSKFGFTYDDQHLVIGKPVHGGKENNLSTGIQVVILPTDNAYTVAEKTALAINSLAGTDFTAAVKLNSSGIATSKISIKCNAKGNSTDIRQGNLLRVSVSTITVGSDTTQEESEAYFLSGIEADASGISAANKAYYGSYFEIFSPAGTKYYVWYKSSTANTEDPCPDSSGWFVSGINSGKVGEDGNKIWYESNEDYVNYNEQSMAVQRTSSEEEDLLIYQKLDIVLDTDDDGNTINPTTYYFSANVYYDGYLKDDNIKFMMGTSLKDVKYTSFDSFERNIGNWWIISKKISITDPTEYLIGIKVDSSQVMYIDGMQLEMNDFVTPYVSNAISEENQLVISKSLMGEDRGTMFFRWKPLFSYDTTEDRILLQVLGRKYEKEDGIETTALNIADTEKGFTIRYTYNKIKKVGYLVYSVNDFSESNNSSWRIKVPAVSWDTWHSSAIIYDYNTDKYVFAFDHYKQVLDIETTKYNMWTDLYIGRDAMSGVDADIAQIVEVYLKGDTSKSLSGKYWKIFTTNSKYYIWYNVDGLSADPMLSNEGYISVPVLISENDDATTVAQRTLIELSTYPTTSVTKDFVITRRNNVLNIKNKTAGKCTSPEDGNSETIFNVLTHSSNSTGVKAHSYESAEIAVKDIILTSNAISETEELKWHNTYEFFNEYLIINTLNSYQDSINDLIYSVEAISSPLAIAKRVDSLEGEMTGLQVSQGNLESDVNLLTNLVQSSQAVALEQIQTDLLSLTTIVNNHSSEMEFMQDGNTGTWTSTLASSSGTKANIYDLRQDVDTFKANLNSEISSRTDGDQLIRNDLASSSLSKGASLVGINDKNSLFPNLGALDRNVEAALQDLCGYDPNNANAHRTTETIYSNSIAINTINDTLTYTNDDISYMKDGTSNGGEWTRTLAQKQKYNIVSLRTDTNNIFDKIALIKDGGKTSAPGYQNINFNEIISDTLPTGLISGDYTVTLKVNGETTTYTVNASNCATWADLKTTLNGEMNGAKLTYTGSNATCRIETIKNGSDQSVEIISSTLFSAASLKEPGAQFISIDSKVDGKDDSCDSSTMNLYTLRTDLNTEVTNRSNYEAKLASTVGASFIGIADTSEMFTSTTVEAALNELAGIGRTTQSIKSNYDMIVIANNNISSNLAEINKMKGTGWTELMSLKSHNDSITTNTTNIASNLAEINKMKGSNWVTSMNLTEFDNRLDIHDTNLTNLTTHLDNTDLALSNEVAARKVADTEIRNDFASGDTGKGASLIAVRDDADYFLHNNVEAVLAELHEQIKTLEGAISWQPPVATYDALPVVDNALGDSRTVQDDGDGHPAQYLCVKITGTREEQWTKIADIDWNNAKDIKFDNSKISAKSTTVQDVIEETWKRTSDLEVDNKVIEVNDWSTTAVDGLYSYSYAHNLDSYDVVLNITDSENNVIGVDQIIRIDRNTVQLKSANRVEMRIYCFAAKNSYSTMINTFENSESRYKATITHNLGSKNCLLSVFNMTTGHKVQPGDIKIIDENNIDIYVQDNSVSLNVYVVRNIKNSTAKDLNAWTLSGSNYVTQIESAGSFDAIYQFFDPSTMSTVDVEDVQISNGRIIVTKSNNKVVRLIIIR